VKFFINVHTAIDHANYSDLIGIYSIKDQMEANHQAAQFHGQTRSLATDEWEACEVLEIVVDPADESSAAFGLRSAI
jgi:hypothetical protein